MNEPKFFIYFDESELSLFGWPYTVCGSRDGRGWPYTTVISVHGTLGGARRKVKRLQRDGWPPPKEPALIESTGEAR